MPRISLNVRAACMAAVLSTLAAPAPAPASAALQTSRGVLPDGTPYRIDFPDHWNGFVLIGLDYAGRDPMAEGDANTANRMLLEQGYAMAGTTRDVTGWAIHKAADNAILTLDLFTQRHGKPKYAIQFGSSQGGHAAAVGIQAYPARWAGAVIQCGGLSGAVGQWHGKFDALFVARTLLPGGADLPITGLPKDVRAQAMPAWHKVLDDAQKTPQGRARIALAARIAQLPDWSDSTIPAPSATDFAARQQGLYYSMAHDRNQVDQALSSRARIESLAGGNISANEGVDYAALYQAVDSDGMVATLYREAGLDLQADLAALARAPRVKADAAALKYVASGVFTGQLQMPVVTLNGIGDPISAVASQQAFQAQVEQAGKGAQLRQLYTASAGHCGFTPGETVAAVGVLKQRLDTGAWPATGAAALNGAARGTARFIDYQPARFLRPFTPADMARALETPAR
jgi:pimeloyl-ACP methyl ester carboxylesterase